ncbi:MAG: zinc ribbon domain-containing protein [Planctomycetota bacterium]|jgi:hypothetical protein
MLASCSHCGAVGRYDQPPEGGTVRCRACGGEFTGGVIPEHIEISPEVETADPSTPRRRPRSGPRARASLARSLALLVPAVPLAVWYATLWRASVFLAGINYACLLVAWGVLTLLASWARPSRLAPAVAMCAILCSGTGAANAWCDRYDIEWSEGGVTYRDTHGRWNPRWNYRHMTGDDFAPFSIRHGPMSASWRPHGRWLLWLGARAPLDIAAHNEWYLEGKPVSETEWETRSGRSAGDR